MEWIYVYIYVKSRTVLLAGQEYIFWQRGKGDTKGANIYIFAKWVTSETRKALVRILHLWLKRLVLSEQTCLIGWLARTGANHEMHDDSYFESDRWCFARRIGETDWTRCCLNPYHPRRHEPFLLTSLFSFCFLVPPCTPPFSIPTATLNHRQDWGFLPSFLPSLLFELYIS